MENIRKQIIEAIKLRRLPENPKEILTELFSEDTTTFPVQESLHWDYKDTFPSSWDGDYFGGILRLICAFYNSYGGIIIFGVDDNTRTIGHNRTHVDIEKLNAILSSWLNTPIECIHRRYVLGAADLPANSVDVLLVPKRPFGVPPARFNKDVGRYRKDVLWARRGHQVLAVEPKDVLAWRVKDV